ncbi:UDP-N-acetylenolpyruvoylglucosamine reductase [Clostridium acetireducens DSM 10703]|jgi:UDP-N-acetylmuramate dehydrogenase|uniref:UDP-N-acetylenolpyruvoylglucosamine reductase n=1 Tax=Clostridium acetireducens DSM 10703 TaxID=1121290 RepID=A0A1E8F1M4_9CLOT|nr:UDP-N-acetylmuramate dehydrogenase [Clostridium acetireducens]OFI07492.1 UDP-N-acetylenolpyruvoylglucosamine reductase [Clostridium acetireducens DSM 10703]
MNQYKGFTIKLKKVFKSENILINEPMKNHTSFKVGGPVDILVMPETYKEVLFVIELCKEYSIPYYLIGNGSNLLVRDGGIRGVVIKLCKLDKVEIKENKIISQCGASITKVSKIALENELKGLEFACGIPGSVGGAATMNAGAYDGDISQVVERVSVIDDKGNVLNLSNGELEFGYRTSAILKYNYIVLEVVFKLEKGNYNDIKNKIEELSKKRREKQPLEFASAGSTFKRPKGHFTGKLIEDSGLKGMRVGDAEVSKKHAGFIINRGNAHAKDILELINFVKKTVKEEYNVELATEVRIIGEDVQF